MSFFDFVLYFIGASLFLSIGVPVIFMIVGGVIAAPVALFSWLFSGSKADSRDIDTNQRRPGANQPPMER